MTWTWSIPDTLGRQVSCRGFLGMAVTVFKPNLTSQDYKVVYGTNEEGLVALQFAVYFIHL